MLILYIYIYIYTYLATPSLNNVPHLCVLLVGAPGNLRIFGFVTATKNPYGPPAHAGSRNQFGLSKTSLPSKRLSIDAGSPVERGDPTEI